MTHLISLKRRKALIVSLAALGCALQADLAVARGAAAVYIEDMTSPELRERIAAGATTILVPIGGTEQNGPHMALGKHNMRAHVLAGRIAERLGNAVVAPTISYVPEGSINPPAAHMRFTGTISVPEPVFESLLEAAARSFRQHGFHDVVFLGDHGGYQKSEEKAAQRLNHDLAGDPNFRAHALLEYYRVTQTAYADELKRRGFSDAEIGTHAGLADTSLTMALDKSFVRTNLLGGGAKGGGRDGVSGDPRRASAELGELGVERIVDTSVAAIRSMQQRHAVQTPFKQK